MCSIDLRPFVSHLKSFPLRFVKEKKEKEESGKKKIKTLRAGQGDPPNLQLRRGHLEIPPKISAVSCESVNITILIQ